MTYIVQTIPAKKINLVQELCDRVGSNYRVKKWALDDVGENFLICLSWETGRGDPISPGLWLFIYAENTFQIRIMSQYKWEVGVPGLRVIFNIVEYRWPNSFLGNKEAIQLNFKDALLVYGKSLDGVISVEINN
jgi:hypothetical protein